MASFGFGKAFKSVWHQLTSYDRHSDWDSPYRTGQHVPLAQNRHAPLTSVATNASESRPDVSTNYFENPRNSTSALNSSAYPQSPIAYPASPGTGRESPAPYSPGLRSQQTSRQNTAEFENVTPGEIQMQAFQEGLPPPPPCSHSWRRIDKWAEEHYEELFDQLGEGCTNNDLNGLEHQLDCSLPLEVRESLQIHDGQEQGGRPTGIIFGSMLMDCEEIVHEWDNWKKVNSAYLNEPVNFKPTTPKQALGADGTATSSKAPAQTAQNPMWRQEFLARQDSIPPNAVQKVYAHPAWIPLVKDWGGNCLAVDLAPGPNGKWGQVILFGRDYDTKYVVARSWSALLATVADDLNSGKWFVDEDTNELKLREFKQQNVEPSYLNILRWRTDQKYGRRGMKRRSAAPPHANGSPRAGSPLGSPYASPTAEVGGEPRGRSMQRFAGASPVSSPNRPTPGGFPKSSPLARVNEEVGAPIKVHTNGIANGVSGNMNGKLIEVPTPVLVPAGSRGGFGAGKGLQSLIEAETPDGNKENAGVGDGKSFELLKGGAMLPPPIPVSTSPSKGKGPMVNGSANGKVDVAEEGDGMKTIEI